MPRAVRSAESARRPSTPRPAPSPVVARSVAAIGVGAVATAFALTPDGVEDGPVICPFRRLTGLPCPGCGLTRSWVDLAHGQLGASFVQHPFGWLLMLAVIGFVVSVAVALVRRRPPPDLDALIRRPTVLVVVGAWLAFSVVRLVLAL